MQFTVMPSGPHSRDRLFAIARCAAFTGAYTGMLTLPSTPAGDVSSMSRPRLPARTQVRVRELGAVVRAPHRGARVPLPELEVDVLEAVRRAPRNALCTMISSPPYRSTVAATHAAIASRRVTSVTMHDRLVAAVTDLLGDGLAGLGPPRRDHDVRALAARSARAIPWPTPWPAPVTIAVRPDEARRRRLGSHGAIQTPPSAHT